ncbi:MAG: SCO family protein [Candidatus Thiodiazotropha sp.]
MLYRVFLFFSLLSLTGTSFGVGGDFTLTADDGSSYSLRDSRGKVVVLVFGYTYCPDVCPTALATISSVLDSLGDDSKRVDALFVSLDPDRDSAELLAEYTKHFHPRLLGLTGTAEVLKQVADRYQVRYSFFGKGEKVHYTMDHSASLYLIDSEGKLSRILPHGMPPKALYESLRSVLSSAKQQQAHNMH